MTTTGPGGNGRVGGAPKSWALPRMLPDEASRIATSPRWLMAASAAIEASSLAGAAGPIEDDDAPMAAGRTLTAESIA